MTCTGTQIGGTFDNVVVPAGQHCTLDGVRVTGKVSVQAGAGLQVTNNSGDSTIGGDIKADACDFVELESTSTSHRIVVGGHLSVQNCTGTSFSGGQGDSTRLPPSSILVGGDVKCNNNAGGCVFDYFAIGGNVTCSGNFDCDLQSDSIGGNAVLNDNSGVGIAVRNSAIGGDLKCTGNASAVTGPPNTVAGTKSGQCSAF